jgi:hypothetical protein
MEKQDLPSCNIETGKDIGLLFQPARYCLYCHLFDEATYTSLSRPSSFIFGAHQFFGLWENNDR